MTTQEFKEILSQCNKKRVVLDTETTGLYWWSDRLVSVGFYCPDANVCGCIDIRDQPELQDEVRTIVRTSLDPGTTVIMHNAKFDLHFLGINPNHQKWKLIDTTVLIHLFDSRMRKSLEEAEKIFLGSNSKREHIDDSQFGEDPPPLFDKDKRKRKIPIWDWNADKRQAYCINDCRVTYQLAETLYPTIRNLGMEKLFWKDMKYLGVLYQIERNGMLVDTEFIIKAEKALEIHQEDLQQRLFDACGKEFNWRSPKQLSAAIYEGLGIPKPKNPFLNAQGIDTTKFTERKQYNDTCTSTFILMEKAKHPLGELISSLRESAKLRKTLQSWLELMDQDNFVHTNFNLTGTRTGRLSSSKPNVQNIPSEVRGRFTQGVFSGGNIRSEEYNLRNAFVARPGHVMLAIDWKQMEMRMFGILSKDEVLMEALMSGTDIHMWIGKTVWGEGDEETNALHREWSKTVTFGLIYGMTRGSLQFKLELPREKAEKIADDYWNRFPRIRPWMFEVIQEVKENGFVRYWSGRIWREEEEQYMYRAANAAIQGGCADLLSIAVIRVQNWLDKKGWGKIVNLVHDEIIVEVPNDKLEEAVKEMAEIMLVPDLFDMPFLVDAKVGNSYGSMEKMEIPK